MILLTKLEFLSKNLIKVQFPYTSWIRSPQKSDLTVRSHLILDHWQTSIFYFNRTEFCYFLQSTRNANSILKFELVIYYY